MKSSTKWIIGCILVLIIASSLLGLLIVKGNSRMKIPEKEVKEVMVNIKSYNVDIKDYGFFPNKLEIKKGEKVVWRNTGLNNHTVIFDYLNSTGSVLLSRNSTYEKIFTETGVYKFKCSLHPYNFGEIKVSE